MDDELAYERRLLKEKLACGKNIIELSTYDGIAMCWSKDVPFYYFIINALNSDTTRESRHSPIFMFVYKILRKNAVLIYYIELLYDLALKVLTETILKIFKRKHATSKNKKRILFVSTDNEWRFVRDQHTNKLRKSDAIFDSIIESSGESYEFIGTYPINNAPIKGLKIFIDKLLNWNILYKPFNVYWSLDSSKKGLDAYKKFSESLKCIKEDRIFREMCIYNGKDIYEQVMNELELYFLFMFPRAVKYVEMGKRMIAKENPDLVLLQNEDGPERYYLVVASKLEGIPTLALQHGFINPTHCGYMHSKDEISSACGTESPYCPIPDKTAVYGTYDKELLTKVSAYPEERVAVTGQPRYDLLYHASEVYSKERFLEEHSIDSKNKIVLWLTQSHWMSDEENIKNFNAVFGAIEQLGRITLLIKQHPRESERYAQMIKEDLGKHSINAVLLPKTSDTFEQLFVCDLMITKDSTTAMEAVALNKPVIVLNLGGKTDIVDYVEQGIASGVYEAGLMKPAIEELLEDDSKQAEKRGKYIEKHLYRIDGKATERIVELIDGMVGRRPA